MSTKRSNVCDLSVQSIQVFSWVIRPRKKIFVYQVTRPTHGTKPWLKKSFHDFLGYNWFSAIFSVEETHKLCCFSWFQAILHFGFSYFSVANFSLLNINLYGFLDWVSSFYTVQKCSVNNVYSMNFPHGNTFFLQNDPKNYDKVT